MAFRVDPRRLDTIITQIEPLHDDPKGYIYLIHYSVNEQSYTGKMRLSRQFRGGFGTFGEFGIFNPISMALCYIAEYVFRFAAGERLDFPIEMGDLGSAEMITFRRDVPHIPENFKP